MNLFNFTEQKVDPIDPTELEVRTQTLELMANAAAEAQDSDLGQAPQFYRDRYQENFDTLVEKGTEGGRGVFSVVSKKYGRIAGGLIAAEELAHQATNRVLGISSRIVTFDTGGTFESLTIVEPENLMFENLGTQLDKAIRVHHTIDKIGIRLCASLDKYLHIT